MNFAPAAADESDDDDVVVVTVQLTRAVLSAFLCVVQEVFQLIRRRRRQIWGAKRDRQKRSLVVRFSCQSAASSSLHTDEEVEVKNDLSSIKIITWRR